METLKNNLVIVDKERYFANEDNDVYVMSHDMGTYGYYISKLIKHKTLGAKTVKVENSTKSQRLYALLNYIFKDNEYSAHKTGIYYLSEEQIYDAFTSFVKNISCNNVKSSEVFDLFALNPSGEYEQGALNGLVKDILLEAGFVKSSKDVNYVFRADGSVEYLALRKSEDGNVYVARPDYKGSYGYEVCKLMPNKKAFIIKNPTKEQNRNALLNLIVADALVDPKKTGIYRKDIEQIEDGFEHILYDMKHDNVEVDDVAKRFGIEYNGELFYSVFQKLTQKVIDQQTKNE